MFIYVKTDFKYLIQKIKCVKIFEVKKKYVNIFEVKKKYAI